MGPLKMGKPMVRESIHGIMEKSMMENGIKGSNMVMAFGRASRAIRT
jgi:hypothetical protein